MKPPLPPCAETESDGTTLGNLINSTHAPLREDNINATWVFNSKLHVHCFGYNHTRTVESDGKREVEEGTIPSFAHILRAYVYLFLNFFFDFTIINYICLYEKVLSTINDMMLIYLQIFIQMPTHSY